MNDRVYNREIERLRSDDRLKRLEVNNVIESCLKDRNIKTLLDVGTGSGLFAEAFSLAGIEITGIDINKEMVEAAKAFIPNGNFLIAPAEEIPFKDESFDATFLGLVFHEVNDHKKSLTEAFRVSKSYTFILEWKYKTEEFGPPLEHRLTDKFIKELALSVGYTNFTAVLQNNLVLYILEK